MNAISRMVGGPLDRASFDFTERPRVVMASPKQYRRFGFLRLWHAENHRRRWGSQYSYRHAEILAEAREAFRMAKHLGSGVERI